MSSQRRINNKDKGFDKHFEDLEALGETKTGINASCKLGIKNMRLPQEHQKNGIYQAKPLADEDNIDKRNGFQSGRINDMGTTDRDVTCNCRNRKQSQGYLNLTPITSTCSSINNRSKSKRKFKIFGGPALPILEAQQQQKLPTGFLQEGQEKHEKWVHLHQIEPKTKCKDMVKGRINPQCSISHTYNAPNLYQKIKSKFKFDQTQLPSIPEMQMKSQTSLKLHQTLSQKQGLLSTHISTSRDLLVKVQSSSIQQQTFIEHFHKPFLQQKEEVREQREFRDSISNIEQFDSESQYADDEQLEIIEKQLQKQRKNDPHQLFFPNNLFQGLKISKRQSEQQQKSKIHYENILDCSDLNLKQLESNSLKLFRYIPIILISLSCLLLFIQAR